MGTAPESDRQGAATGNRVGGQHPARAQGERRTHGAQSDGAEAEHHDRAARAGTSARSAPIQPVPRLSVSSRADSSSIPSGMPRSWKSADGTATAVA